MTPARLLKTTSILLFLFALGHTGGFLAGTKTSSGPAEDAVLASMKGFHFDAMGSDRTIWDFWVGFNLSLSVLLLALGVLAWQAARAWAEQPRTAGRLAATLGVACLAIGALCWKYFFVLPASFSTLAGIAAIVAWRKSRAAAGT